MEGRCHNGCHHLQLGQSNPPLLPPRCFCPVPLSLSLSLSICLYLTFDSECVRETDQDSCQTDLLWLKMAGEVPTPSLHLTSEALWSDFVCVRHRKRWVLFFTWQGGAGGTPLSILPRCRPRPVATSIWHGSLPGIYILCLWAQPYRQGPLPAHDPDSITVEAHRLRERTTWAEAFTAVTQVWIQPGPISTYVYPLSLPFLSSSYFNCQVKHENIKSISKKREKNQWKRLQPLTCPDPHCIQEMWFMGPWAKPLHNSILTSKGHEEITMQWREIKSGRLF